MLTATKVFAEIEVASAETVIMSCGCEVELVPARLRSAPHTVTANRYFRTPFITILGGPRPALEVDLQQDEAVSKAPLSNFDAVAGSVIVGQKVISSLAMALAGLV